MALLSMGYPMIIVLSVIWLIMSVLIVKFWSNKRVKGGAVALFGVLVLSMYENVHLYNTYLHSSQNRMSEIVGHMESAVQLIHKGDNVDAALQVAAAGGAMRALGNTPDGRIIHGNAAQLGQLGDTLEVNIAPSIATSQSESTPAIQFVEYAGKVFSPDKNQHRYPLSTLHSQLQNIMKHAPS